MNPDNGVYNVAQMNKVNPYAPSAGGRGRIMTDSPYAGQQIDVNAANNLMAGDRARKIQREWNRKELRNMGNSPSETGEYGPMDPDTGMYDYNVRAKEEPMKRMKSLPAKKIRANEPAKVVPQPTKAYGGQYMQGGSYGNNDLYKEGGTYYLSGGQIAKLKALGYDVQEH